MAKNVISPFSGTPRTIKVAGKNGASIYRVFPRELTPVRAKAADGIALASCFGGMAEAVLYLADMTSVPDHYWVGAFAGPLALYPIAKRLTRGLFAKGLRIEMSGERFRVKRWFGWRAYDRQIPHRFSLVPHRKAEREQEAHMIAQQQAAQRGQMIRKRAYYGQSFHLVFEYLGHAHELAEIYGQERALKVLARLKACDDVLNHEAGNSEGIATDPKDQWDDAPGGIPETD